MKNAHSRLSRLEQSVAQAVPVFDWKLTTVYAEMNESSRAKLDEYTDRFNRLGLAPFTDDELTEFELFLRPFVTEEQKDDWNL